MVAQLDRSVDHVPQLRDGAGHVDEQLVRGLVRADLVAVPGKPYRGLFELARRGKWQCAGVAVVLAAVLARQLDQSRAADVRGEGEVLIKGAYGLAGLGLILLRGVVLVARR
ncbi:hypothetical protein [Nocardia sp. NPDC050175]|uniref:hypothetical protein n=1 Tax=Nocardia sp. NPDC050175 TaxID=3364317 RepID=UPI0037919EB3